MVKKRGKAKKATVPRELERSGSLSLAFANTAAPTRDDRWRDSRVIPPAPSYAGLVTWTQQMGALTPAAGERLRHAAAARPRDAAAVLGRAVELRAVLLRLFTAVVLRREPAAPDLTIFNRALKVRQVAIEGDGFGWYWREEAEVLDSVL